MLEKNTEAKLPVLLFLLENNKFQQIVKAMLNNNVSDIMLHEYGASVDKFSPYEERKIKKSVKNFTLDEVPIFVMRG